MKPATSSFHTIRDLRYHVRSWGRPGAPTLFLLHGWMDLSASFQFVVDALEQDWHVIAPDWRGFGLSEWNQGVYWFPDYLADLEALLRIYSPDAPVDVAGHSMGGNIAGLYAGIRPERVRRLILIEGFGLPATEPAQSPDRYRRWLDQVAGSVTFRPYASFDELAQRLRRDHPRLSADRAAFLAHHWGQEIETGRVELRGDPKHKMVNPVLYRIEEALSCWRQATAPALAIRGTTSNVEKWLADPAYQYPERRAAFRDLRELTIDDAGHMIHLDQPIALARAIESFFRDDR